MSDLPGSYDRWRTSPPDEPEWDECPDCEDGIDPDTGDTCQTCNGEAEVPPPTREEIREVKDEQRFETMRDEGEI